MSAAPTYDRLLELLAARAADDCTADERRELDALAARHPEIADDELDRAAAALAVLVWEQTKWKPAERLPASLAESLRRQGAQWTAEAASPRSGAQITANGEVTHRPAVRGLDDAAVPGRRPAGAVRRGPSALAFTGWLAAAAAVVLAAIGWLRPGGLSTPPGGSAAASASAQLAVLLREAPETVRTPWNLGGDATASGASGEVVWNQRRQEGFMVLKGLAKNDPAKEQYQLWIFDKTRDERYPVDGGVFDVVGDDVVVKITPHLSVPQATLFAVTVERPGGVWVSDRSRIAVLADVTAATKDDVKGG